MNPTRLDALDRGLLASIIRQPGASYSTWAQENGVSARTIARRYEALHRRGVIRVIGRTLPGFGGRIPWLVRIQGSPQRLGPIAAELAAMSSTRWVRHSLDRGELISGIVTGPRMYEDLLSRLHSSIPPRNIMVYQLLEVWSHTDSVTYGAEAIDEVDEKLLAEYAVNGRITAREIADKVGIDPATVSRHRRHLIDSGILFFEADIHPDALTNFGDFSLWMRVEPGKIDALGKHLCSLHETRFVAATSGEQQIYANVVLPSAADLLAFVDGLAGRGIVSFETVPMGAAVKRFK